MPAAVVADTAVLVGAAVFVFVGFAAAVLFERLRIPDVVTLLLVGLLAGPILGLVKEDAFADVAGPLATLALVVILFEGGLDLDWPVLRRKLGLTTVLLLVSYFLTAVAVAWVTILVTSADAATSILFGLVAAPLASSVLIPLLGRLKILPETKAILTVESALGDVLAVVAVLTIADGLAASGIQADGVIQQLLTSLVLGSVLAVGAAVVWLLVLRYIRGRAYSYMVTFAAALLLYGTIEGSGGNGVVAVLVFALVLGNADHVTRHLPGFKNTNLDDRIKWFHAEMSFLVRTAFFLYLGISIDASSFGAPLLIIVGATFATILATRGIVVWLLVRRRPKEREDVGYLTLLVPRGLASAALAGSPAVLAVATLPLDAYIGGLILLSNVVMAGFIMWKENGFGTGADPEATFVHLEDLRVAAALEDVGPAAEALEENGDRAP